MSSTGGAWKEEAAGWDDGTLGEEVSPKEETFKGGSRSSNDHRHFLTNNLHLRQRFDFHRISFVSQV